MHQTLILLASLVYLSIKRSARWIGPFLVKKFLHPDVYVLDLGKRVCKSWHPIFHVSLLKKYQVTTRSTWPNDLRGDK